MNPELDDLREEVTTPRLLIVFALVILIFGTLSLDGSVYRACEYYVGRIYAYPAEKPVDRVTIASSDFTVIQGNLKVGNSNYVDTWDDTGSDMYIGSNLEVDGKVFIEEEL